MKSSILTAIRFLAVTILYFGSFVVVSGALLSTAPNESAPADGGATLIALLVVSLINAAVWTYVIRRSSWTGWKLVLTVFLVFYGANTLMPQIETAYFVTRLPPGMLPRRRFEQKAVFGSGASHRNGPAARICRRDRRTKSLLPLSLQEKSERCKALRVVAGPRSAPAAVEYRPRSGYTVLSTLSTRVLNEAAYTRLIHRTKYWRRPRDGDDCQVGANRRRGVFERCDGSVDRAERAASAR